MNFYSKLGALIDRYEKLVNAPVVVSRRPGKMMEYQLSCDAMIGFDIPSSFVFRQGVGGKVQIAERQYLLGGKAPVNVECLNFIDAQKVELARAMGFGVPEPMPKTGARWAIITPGVCKLFGIPYNNPDFTVAKLADLTNKKKNIKNTSSSKMLCTKSGENGKEPNEDKKKLKHCKKHKITYREIYPGG